MAYKIVATDEMVRLLDQILSGEFVYIMRVFHSLEDYPRKIEVIWNGKLEK